MFLFSISTVDLSAVVKSWSNFIKINFPIFSIFFRTETFDLHLIKISRIRQVHHQVRVFCLHLFKNNRDILRYWYEIEKKAILLM